MILKKPYAFLIKHFKIIHLLLVLPIGYLIYRTNSVVEFFKSYIDNDFSTNIVNIAAEYISLFMYLGVFIILGVTLSIYYLMKQKRKSTSLYFCIVVYYLMLFIFIGVTHSILSKMEIGTITAQLARGYRDVSFIFILPQYFFFLYMLARGIGFDIKKFDFASDAVDLEINDIDREEFEFDINIEGYKIERNIRRYIRELKYYIQENTFVFCCILAFIFIFIGTSIYLHFEVYNKTYNTNQSLTHNYFNMKITDSVIGKMGYNGKDINDKYYLAIQLYIENKTDYNYELDYNNIRLTTKDKSIYPILDRGDYFIDLGVPYKDEKIRSKTKNYYVLVYEIDETDINNEFKIKIREGIDYKIGEIIARYKFVNLAPKRYNEIKIEEELDLNKIGNFKNSNIGYTTFKINSYNINNSYIYSYPYCYNNGNCTELKDKITVDVKGENTTLLILNMEYNIDRNSVYGSNLKSDLRFFDDYFSVGYEKDNKMNYVNVVNRTTNMMKDTIVFEVSEKIKTADKLDLLVTIRDKRYVFKLK